MEVELKELRTFVETPDSGLITDRVKTFADALRIHINKNGPLSKYLESLFEYDGNDKDLIAAQAFAQMSLIRRVLNEGWAPDWTNSSEIKYYPWFTMSGVGLSCYVYGNSCAGSGVGSRLCFKTKDLAIYAGKQFTSIYEKFFIL